MTQYDVRPESLEGHSKTVGSYSSRLSTAASAAETTLDSGAFGLVNTFLGVAVTGLAGIAQDSITNRSKDMTETMANLTQVAKQYSGDDDSAKANIDKSGGGK